MPSAETTPTVLHYLGYDEDRGGIASVVRALAGAGRFECVLGMNRGCVQRSEPALPLLELPRVEGERIDVLNVWRARAVSRSVRAWLAADARRVFHGHSRAGLLVALWLRWCGERRVVVSVHCYGRQRWFYRWAARRLKERIVWLTPEMKRYYEIGEADWRGCIPNGLPVRPSTARARPWRSGRVTVGGAGLLVGWKRWNLVLEAMARLPERWREGIEFLHAGAATDTTESAAYARRLSEQTKELGLASQVSWLGWQASLDELLSRIDVLVVPSTREPFSMTALEALRAGVPVIAANEGGPRDFVREGANGWFFRSGDADDLARVLTSLLATDALARVAIDERDLARFDLTTVAGQWASLYARAIGSGD